MEEKNKPVYHVGAGAFGIYAGTVDKSGKFWKSKTDVTEEVVDALRDYLTMIAESEGHKSGDNIAGWEWTRKDGKKIILGLSIKDADTRREE